MRNGVLRCMLPLVVGLAVVGFAGSTAVSGAREKGAPLALTPPMGWNSWDSWGLAINEQQFRDSVTWFHNNLQRFSWQYVVVDEGWFLEHPEIAHPENGSAQLGYTMSDEGLYMPAVNRFPSAAGGKGFRPLADWVHAQGLKFGIHIIRGIPREAVRRNLRIADSHFTAAEAADTSDTCSWNSDNYGLKNNKAAQAWYDSVAELYAHWGVDYLKVDCISRPWKADEIHMMQEALHRTGRAIVLSLSPGPTRLEDAQDAVRSAQLWRISDDMWDLWSKPAGAPEFPQSLKNQFDLLAKWEPFAGPGHWPDADMLPIGYLGPTPGWGEARQTRLTRDEVRTTMTLWSIARSPLFIGTNLLHMDSFTESVLTSPELIDVDQYSENNHPLFEKGDIAVWTASAPQHASDYFAIFNLSDAQQTVNYSLTELGEPFGHFAVRDLWERQDLGHVDHLQATLPPHASKIFKVQLR